MRRSTIATLLLVGVVSACGAGSDGLDAAAEPSAETGTGERAPAEAHRPKIVFLGDSLTAGYGVEPDEAFPALLARRLEREGYPFEVVNAGVPGDTSAGGLRRLDWVLDGDVRILVVALGGNDGLRGLPVDELEANLSRIVATARGRGIAVLLAGMEAPPNQGDHYTGPFRAVFPAVAERYGAALMPFLLDGVAGEPSLNQPDGIHPNAEGHRRIAERLWPYLEPLVEAATRSP